jgi:Rrf2 family protein
MFSQTVEYALRAVVCLAQHPGRSMTGGEIAQLTCVPAGYLSKVLQSLGRAGLIVATRGLHGGYALGAPPGTLSLLRVISAIEPIKRITECPLKIESHGPHLCALHRRLDDMLEHFESVFGNTTVADLILEPACSRPLCHVEPRPAHRAV